MILRVVRVVKEIQQVEKIESLDGGTVLYKVVRKGCYNKKD